MQHFIWHHLASFLFFFIVVMLTFWLFLLLFSRCFFFPSLCLLSCFHKFLVLMLVLSWIVCVPEKSWRSFLVFLSSKDLHYNRVMFFKYPCLFCCILLFCLCSYFHDFFVIYLNINVYLCCFSFIVQVWSYFHNFLCAPKRWRWFFWLSFQRSLL
jgi:hypothetical protein